MIKIFKLPTKNLKTLFASSKRFRVKLCSAFMIVVFISSDIRFSEYKHCKLIRTGSQYCHLIILTQATSFKPTVKSKGFILTLLLFFKFLQTDTEVLNNERCEKVPSFLRFDTFRKVEVVMQCCLVSTRGSSRLLKRLHLKERCW